MNNTTRRAQPRLMLLEFNELCPGLVDQFIGEGLLPNFRRLRDRSETFITQTDDAMLEPWIQWVTVHTGVAFAEHGIVDLDEAPKLHHEVFWERLRDGNVLLMSPMNVRFERRDDSIFMPDPWAASQQPSPDIAPLYKFVRAAVNSHARSGGLPTREAAAALAYLATHGLSMQTLRAVARQLWQEARLGEDAKWRRAMVMDQLLWDVFAHYWKSRRQPQLGVFFSNATAHYQHKYWRHHDPAAFGLPPPAAELAIYGNAIRSGYQAHDRLIGKALELADGNTSISLCTALSQQPMRDYEARGGKAMFVPKDFPRLLGALGVRCARVEHVMAEESWLHFNRSEDAEHAARIITNTRTDDGRAVFKTRNFDGSSFIVGCDVFASEVGADTSIVSGNARLSFNEHFVRLPTTTSAKHHPGGLFWLATPGVRCSSQNTAPLPLTQVRSRFEQALGMVPKLEPEPLVSVIITNYNYGSYVAQAIDSALRLDWPHVEVIVVDDGSTDDSRTVLAGYGSRITTILQENSGQLVGTNKALAQARGEIVIMLDADDVLQPALMREVMAVWTPSTSKVQVQMQTIDAQGRPVGTYCGASGGRHGRGAAADLAGPPGRIFGVAMPSVAQRTMEG